MRLNAHLILYLMCIPLGVLKWEYVLYTHFNLVPINVHHCEPECPFNLVRHIIWD